MKTKVLISVLVLFSLINSTVFSQTSDFGDAPAPYPTLLPTGAEHPMIGPPYPIQLGLYIDSEPNGLPNVTATGDDMNNIDDADGVVFNSWIIAGQTASVIVYINGIVPGVIDAWIDYNINGSWLDAGEQIFAGQLVNAGTNNLTFNVPPGISTGTSYVRIRCSTSGCPLPSGIAPDGEVEDYQLWLGAPPTGDIYADPDPTMAFTQNEISMAIIPDPEFGITPTLVIAAYNDEPFPGGPGIGVSRTVDGGGNWTNTQLAYPNNPFSGVPFLDVFDPTVCIDDSAHVFVGHIATDNNWAGGPASGLYVHKSVDGGMTFIAPVQVDADNAPSGSPDPNYRFNDRDQIVADKYSMSPYYKNIYIAWIKDRGWNMPLPYGDIYFSYSTDGGASFSASQQINSVAHNMGNMPVPDVAKDGTVYVAWVDYDVTLCDTGVIFLDKSSNGGLTFGQDIVVDTILLPPCNLNGGTDARAKGAAVLKVKPSDPNELYIVFAEDPDGQGSDEADIFFIKSTDGGTSWSAPVRINDDITNTDQVMPWMYVKPNGIIDIAWYDRRNDPTDLMWDIYYTTSTDGGNTFAPNMQVNGTSFFTPSPWKTSPERWMGEYLGLVADYYHAFIVYTTSVPDMNGDVVFAKPDNAETNLDWGDAPDSYKTSAVNDGARHIINGQLYLGASIDAEPEGRPGVNAIGDDVTNLNDEDGVVFINVARRSLYDTLHVTASMPGQLNGWYDFNADGDWDDPGEHAINNIGLIGGLNVMYVYIPANASIATTYIRFRFASYTGLSYTGLATDGEVEDYKRAIHEAAPDNRSVNADTVKNGQKRCYDAVDTLKVAEMSPVVVQDGGEAYFITANLIKFYPGFQADSGSYMEAYVTTSNSFCSSLPPIIPSTLLLGDEFIIEPEQFDQDNPDIKIHPNPNTGRFTIDFSRDEFNADLMIMNFQGNKLSQIQIRNQRAIELDICNFPSGMYLVLIRVNDSVISRKIIKY